MATVLGTITRKDWPRLQGRFKCKAVNSEPVALVACAQAWCSLDNDKRRFELVEDVP